MSGNKNNKPSGNVTFLFTDIEGSTKLAQEFPDTLPSALERHNSIVRKAIESNNGFIFKTIGDAFCCAFAYAEDAVMAAVESQTNLANENWKDAVIKIRIGIHSGTAEWNGSDYMGYLTLARSARIMSSANAEQIIISNDVYKLTKDKYENHNKDTKTKVNEKSDIDHSYLSDLVVKKISFRDLGERRLKDVIQPLRLYQVLAKGLREDFPPLKTLDARPNNLPVQLTSFIGREKETGFVKDLFKKNSLLTLIGPGGAGKTRFAMQIAADVIDEFANGVWITELASVSDPLLLTQAVMKNFDLKDESNKDPLETLIEYFKKKELLLVLDNCEHLINACAELAETLLCRNQNLKILATSREALRCDGEQIHMILSLEFPDPKNKLSPEHLLQFESVRLFTERAIAVDSKFRINNENAGSVAEICYRLDGIPLAVELAATRTKIMSVEKINERLNNRFTLLTGGKRTALPRQQTLKALIDWSYDLLSEEEKILWHRLSVFSDGWTLEAAEEICCDENKMISGEYILDLLIQLTEKSIVIYDTLKERYRNLESIKHYGEEKLKESGEAENIYQKHLIYFMEFAERAESKLEGNEIQKWLEKLEREHSNFQTSINRSISDIKNEDAARLAGALGKFWELHGHYTTGVRILEKINTNVLNKPLTAKVLFSSGILNSKLGQYEKAGKHFKESLEIRKELTNKKGTANCLHGLGNLDFLQGKFEQARIFFEESLNIRREINDNTGISNSLIGLGSISFYHGEYEYAKKFFEESLTLRRQTGDTAGIAESINGLGGVEFGLGNFENASSYYSECLNLSREIGQKSGIAYSLYSLGNIEYNRGNYDKVKEFINEGLSLFREIGDKRGIALSVYCLAQVSRNQENFEDAKAYYTESLSLYKEINDKSGSAFSINGMGTVEYELGNYEQAQILYEDCLSIRKEISDKRGIAYSLVNIGNAVFAQDEYMKANKLFKESLMFFKEKGEKLGVIDSVLGIAGTLIKTGEFENSLKLLGTIETALRSTGTVFDRVKIKLQNELLEELRNKFSGKDFEKYFDEGRNMTLNEAADFVISQTEFKSSDN